jgi:hypothetical protein
MDVCAEKLPLWQAVHPMRRCSRRLPLPPSTPRKLDPRRCLAGTGAASPGGLGPVTRQAFCPIAGMVEAGDIELVLTRLQSEGYVMQGHFTAEPGDTEWCERHLLARIHRYTIGRLRREIEPVSRRELMRFPVRLAARIDRDPTQRTRCARRHAGPAGRLRGRRRVHGNRKSCRRASVTIRSAGWMICAAPAESAGAACVQR